MFNAGQLVHSRHIIPLTDTARKCHSCFYGTLCRETQIKIQIHVIGDLPPIVQEIPCDLWPQRRVPASQLRGETTGLVKKCSTKLCKQYSQLVFRTAVL